MHKTNVRFKDSKTINLFEKKIDELNQKTYPMGIEEILLTQAETKGIEKGIEKGAEQTQKTVIIKMLPNATLAEIASFLDVSIDQVIYIINKYKLNAN